MGRRRSEWEQDHVPGAGLTGQGSPIAAILCGWRKTYGLLWQTCDFPDDGPHSRCCGERARIPPRSPRAQSHRMLPAWWGNKLRTLSSDVPRCFTEKDLMEQLLKVLSDRKNKYVLRLSIKHQLNNTIIVESHTEHSVQASLLIREWTKIFTLAVVSGHWLDARCPPKLLYHSLSSAGQGRENKMKGSWVKIRTGRSLTNYHHGQNRLDLGKKLI